MTIIPIINHLWQSTVVGLAILGVLLFLGRRLSAGTRRTLGWIALAKFALPAAWVAGWTASLGNLALPWFGRARASAATPWPWAMRPPTFLLRLPAPNFFPSGVAHTGNIWTGLDRLALTLSLVISAALFASWIHRGIRLRRRILAAAAPLSGEVRSSIGAVAARMKLAQAPRCLATQDRHGPGVLGLWSPIVVLPRALEANLSSAELEAILIHEFAHWQRRDNVWSAVQAFFVSLFWFNPVVWLLSRSISLETERSCDERVLAITADPVTYADGIVKAARFSLGLGEPNFAGAASLPLVARIRGIMAFGSRTNRPWVRRAALAAGCLLAALGTYAGALREDPSNAGAPKSAVDQPSKSPQLSAGTKPAFVKVKALLAAKDYDGVLAILQGLEPSVGTDSYDRSVILDTEAKVLWQGKNRPAASIQPWEELLRLAERHPDYLEPKDQTAHLLYLAQAYYLASTGAEATSEEIKRREIDRALDYQNRWLSTSPVVRQEDRLFYTSLLYQKAIAGSGKVDRHCLALAKSEAEKALRSHPHPKEQFYMILVAIAQQENDLKQAAHLLELLVTKNPAQKAYWKQLAGLYSELAAQSDHSPELRQEYLDRALETRQRSDAIGLGAY